MKNNFYKVTAENGVVFYKDKMLGQVDFINHAFSTRIGGVSNGAYTSLNLGKNPRYNRNEVLENYRLFSDAIGISTKHMVLSDQVHNDVIHIATCEDCGKGTERESNIFGVDGLITNEVGVALATFYADCTPILIVDPKKRTIASVHSGWRGTLLRIAQKAVWKLQETFHCDPSDLLCSIGPSIKQCHFEVGHEVYEQFYDVFGDLVKDNTLFQNNKYYINTDQLNKKMLMSLGVQEERISICPECTYCKNDLFFSHRGDKGDTGRMCAVIALK